MNILSIIANKRDKKVLSKEEIDFFVEGYTRGTITDYQAAALIMAIYINGMTYKETTDLTLAMAASGDTWDLSDIPDDISIDKHSTGGVGDKVTIILMPIIAALGIPAAKLSGRGLGFTGGTADKLEAIPGYRTDISLEEFEQNIRDIGISIITSSLNIAPADKKIYALRDTISCTASIPLIASSIMSKKLALGAKKIIIELTCGDGAFMKNLKDAKELADTMIRIGRLAKREVRCVITNMDEPLGYTVGNSLEMVEAIKALRGDMPEDVKEVVYSLATQMLLMVGKAKSVVEAEGMIAEVINSGQALIKFEELVEKQGGDITYISNPDKFEKASHIVPIVATERGALKAIKTEMIGHIAVYLGAGRMKKEDKIDPAAGIVINQKIGNVVEVGDVLAYIHTNDESKIEGAARNLKEAFILDPKRVAKPKAVLGIIK